MFWQPGLERVAFDAAIARIHAAIAAGDCYQINYTAQLAGRLLGDARRCLPRWRAQPGGYVACLDDGVEQVLSVSPRLFFDWDGERILTRPMKGTAARGATPAQDAALARGHACLAQGAGRERDDRGSAAQRPVAHRRGAACACPRHCSMPSSFHGVADDPDVEGPARA